MRILFLLLLLAIPSILALEECKPVTSPQDIPCQVTIPWTPPNACNTYTSTVYNGSGVLVATHTLVDFSSTGLCSFNFTNSSVNSYLWNSTTGDTGNILVEDNDNMFATAIMLIPLVLAFLFIYWGNSLNEENEPLKWFFRFLAIIMIFPTLAGASVLIGLNPFYAGMEGLISIRIIGVIFWFLVALFIVFFLFRWIKGIHDQKKIDFDQGIMK